MRLMTRVTLVITTVAFLCSIVLGQHSYKTYTNARFAYSISYPSDLLRPQGEAANGDGQKFSARDGRAELIVYGSYKLDKTLKETFDEEANASADHPKRVVTYKVLRAGWFVVSGREAGKVFYQKTILKGDTFKSFRIEYDQAQKAALDPIVKVIEKSFRG